MPTYSEAIEFIKSSDNGLMFLVVCCAFVVTAGVYVARRVPTFASVSRAFSTAFVPALSFVSSPLLGLVAAGAAWQAPRLRVRSLPYPLLFILTGALIIRLPMMFSSFWYDETFTMQVVSLRFEQLPAAILADVHPPLFYLMLWFWKFISTSEFWMRLPVIIFGLVAIALLYRLALHFTKDRTVALIAAALAAVLPAQAYYATELRSYSFLTCLIFGALLALFENKRLTFVVCMALLPWTHNVGFFYAGVIGIAAVLYRRDFLPFTLSSWVIGGTWAAGAYMQTRWMTDPDGHWTWFVPGTAFHPIFNMTFGVNGVGSEPVLMIAVFALTGAALIVGWRGWLRSREGLLWLALVFGVPCIVAVLSEVWRPIYVWRHMFPSAFLLIIAWAYMLKHYTLAQRVFLPVLVLAVLNFATTGYSTMRQPYEQWLLDYCPRSTSLYATSINSAFTVAQNSLLPVLVWSGAQDNGRTVANNMLPLYNFERGEIGALTGYTCILWFDRPEGWEAERDYIGDLLVNYRSTIHTESLNGWNTVRVIELDLEN
jgi:hypothetical protein